MQHYHASNSFLCTMDTRHLELAYQLGRLRSCTFPVSFCGFTPLVKQACLLSDVDAVVANHILHFLCSSDVFGCVSALKHTSFSCMMARLPHLILRNPIECSLKSALNAHTLGKLETLEISSNDNWEGFHLLDGLKEMRSLRTLKLINMSFEIDTPRGQPDHGVIFISALGHLRELENLDLSGLSMIFYGFSDEQDDESIGLLGQAIGKLHKLKSFAIRGGESFQCSLGMEGAFDWERLAEPIAELPCLCTLDITGAVRTGTSLAESLESLAMSEVSNVEDWVGHMNAVDALFPSNVEILHIPWERVFAEAMIHLED